jgi:excisionase family DNA binding protein
MPQCKISCDTLEERSGSIHLMQTTIQPMEVPQVQPTSTTVLTLEEVAEYLRLPIESVRDHAMQGLLPGNEIQGEWRFLRSAIDRWLEPPTRNPIGVQGRVTDEEIQAARAKFPALIAVLDHWTTPDNEAYQTEIWHQLDQNLPRHLSVETSQVTA